MRLYPHTIRSSVRAASISGIHDTTRLDQHNAALRGSRWLVLDSLGHDVHLSGLQMDGAIAKLDIHFTIQDNESFIRVRVAVPEKLALNLDELELVVIHLRDDFRCPMIREFGQLVSEIDDGIHRSKEVRAVVLQTLNYCVTG